MASSTITNLPTTTGLNDEDLYIVQVGDVTKKIQYNLKRLWELQDQYNAEGYNVVGNFVEGCTVTSENDWVLASNYTLWSYTGSFPFIISNGTVPSDPDYQEVKVSDHNQTSNRNAIGAHDSIYSRGYATVADMLAEAANLDDGVKVNWRGYYSESDGGSNWGIIRKGDSTALTDDGGSIFVAVSDPVNGVWIEANLKGKRTNVKKFGAVGDGVTDDTTAIQAAINYAGILGWVYSPKGNYKTSAALNVLGSFSGDGSGTRFIPSGGHEILTIRTGRADYQYAGFVGDFVLSMTNILSPVPADVGMWLSKGTTPAANSGINNVLFSNIMIHGGYRSIQMLSTDLGNLWNVKFQNIMCFRFTDRGIYIDATGSAASLEVDFDGVVCDAFNNTSAKACVISGIGNLRYKGVASAPTGTNGSCLNILNSTNVDVWLQIESAAVTAPIASGLVSFANCKTVALSLTAHTCNFNQGAGNLAHFVYCDTNVETFTLRAFSEYGNVYTSGTTYVLNLQSGAASNTKLCILDQNITRSDVFAATANLNATKWPDTNYALEKTQTTRRVQALDVSVTTSATNLISVADYANRAYQVAGLYLVQGTNAGDSNIGFTDLVLVTGVGQTVAQTAVTVSSNSIGGGAARTYTVSGGYLQAAMATGTYRVSITGFDQAGALS
jgi:hypothetical protein